MTELPPAERDLIHAGVPRPESLPYWERKAAETAEHAVEIRDADRAVSEAEARLMDALGDVTPVGTTGLARIAGRYAVAARAWTRLGLALEAIDVPSSARRAIWAQRVQAARLSREWRARANARRADDAEGW